MIATADSSINSIICALISSLNKGKFRWGPVFPNSVNNKWPAIIFAASRTAKVPGRIKFLIVSIHTMNGIRMGGVPCGTKWANICCILLIQPKIINLNHRGNAKVNVKDKWLVLVKI